MIKHASDSQCKQYFYRHEKRTHSETTLETCANEKRVKKKQQQQQIECEKLKRIQFHVVMMTNSQAMTFTLPKK